MTNMFPIYSERQFSQSRPETEQEYFMREARSIHDQRRRERRQRVIARVTGRPHGKSA
ncbi:MAG TPA: hypothetical protein VGL44_17305 [Gaiellales bacterium]|jgi:hypothetical protein